MEIKNRKELLNILKLKTIETVSEMVKQKGLDLTGEKIDEINNYYETIFTNKKAVDNIYHSLDFLRVELEKGSEIFFANEKVYKKKFFTGLFFDKRYVENEPVGIMALTKEALYDLDIKENEIATVNKNTPFDKLLELFVYNNLYFLPQKVISNDDYFKLDKEKKFENFWKFSEKASEDVIPLYAKVVKETKEYTDVSNKTGGVYDTIYDICYEAYLDVSPTNFTELRFVIKRLFESSFTIKEHDYLKNAEYRNFFYSFPVFNTGKKFMSSIMKDFTERLVNNEEDVSFSLLKIILIKSENVFNKELYDFLLDFLNFSPEEKEIEVINKMKLLLSLDNCTPVIYRYGEDLNFKLEMVNKLYEFMIENKSHELFEKNKDLIENFKNFVDRNKEIDEVFTYIGNVKNLMRKITVNSYDYALMTEVFTLMNKNNKVNVKIINDMYYITSKNEMNKEALDEILFEKFEKLIKLRAKITFFDSNIKTGFEREELNKIFSKEIMFNDLELKVRERYLLNEINKKQDRIEKKSTKKI